MIPYNSKSEIKAVKVAMPSLSYELKNDNSINEVTEHIGKSGSIDNINAVVQAIYKILMTERYKYLIYSSDYGIDLKQVYGKPLYMVIAMLPPLIEEALLIDDRIKKVSDFNFTKLSKTDLKVTFVAETIYGTAPITWNYTKEVNYNV